MKNVFKILTIIFLLFPNNSFCSEWSGHSKLRFFWDPYDFEFTLSVNIDDEDKEDKEGNETASITIDKEDMEDMEGNVTASISDLKFRHQQQAWVSFIMQPKITKIVKKHNGILVYISIHFSGVSYNVRLVSGKLTYGPDTFHQENTFGGNGIRVFVTIPDDQIPGHFHIGELPPFEFSSELPNNQNEVNPSNPSNPSNEVNPLASTVEDSHTQPSQPEQPESNNPCNLVNRISKSIPASRIEFSDRTFLKFKKGSVRIKPVGCDQWIRAENNTDLKLGDKVKTGSNGRATIVIKGTAFVKVKPDSVMTIIPSNSNPPEKVSFIKLAKGVLWAHAKKEKNSLKIATPHAVCGVRGTEFEVSYINGKSCVKTLKHTVWFSDIEKKHVVVVPEGMMSCMTDQEIKPSSPETITGN